MIKVDYKNCSGCGACENICAVDAIKMVKNSKVFYILRLMLIFV